jgi:antibiotic biosynthesis monooxygenase (ABM) superfamily enzyme
MVRRPMQPTSPQNSAPPRAPNRHKATLLTWLGIWPTITCVLWVLLPVLLPRLPLPLLTLCVTAIVVPLMSYVMMPFLFRRFDGWLRR